MFLMGLITFCVLRIVAQSSFPELFAMRHHMKPAQQEELARREAKSARREQQEDIADLSESQLEDIGPMFLASYVLKMFCAWIGMG